jgi:hypothetical protein
MFTLIVTPDPTQELVSDLGTVTLTKNANDYITNIHVFGSLIEKK